jgi:hypothetical protein
MPPTHRACVGLGPDTLSAGWIAFAYVFTILVGWTFLGALLASLPYYQWRRTYPEKAKRYNRHVWIAFGISLALRVLLWAAVATPHHR